MDAAGYASFSVVLEPLLTDGPPPVGWLIYLIGL